MAKVVLREVEKSFGGRDLFKGLSLELDEGMRLAVAGPNGGGKSTLLKILAGVETPDAGQLIVPRGARVGYVAQELSEEDLACPLLGWVLAALPSWSGFWREWEHAARDHDEAALARLSREQAELEHSFGYNPEHKARAVLSGLGFFDEELSRPVRALSGGWRERAKLARVLLQGADVLLLDEPTNHLDIEAVEWLERYLLSFRGAVAFVAHDRIFLDKVSTHVLFIAGGRAVLRKGDFSTYVLWEEECARLRDKEQAKLAAKIEHEYDYIRRFRVKARKAAQAQAKLRRVEKMQEELTRSKDESRAARPGRSLSFSLPTSSRGDKSAITAVDLAHHYGDLKHHWPPLTFHIFRGKKIALVAPNGAGKSSLLRLAAGLAQPTSGSIIRGGNTKIGYFSQHQTEILQPTATVLAEARRLSDPEVLDQGIKDVLGLFMLGEDYFDRPVSRLSGGEKSRLVLASLFLAKSNLLIMDEPTNHLDLESRQALVDALADYEGALFLVAHDRFLISEVADEVWVLGPDGLTQYLGGYPEYEEKRQALAKARDSEARSAAREADARPRAEEAPSASRRLTKEDKRRQAEIRNRLSKDLKPRKEAYAAAEAELEALMAEQSETETRLHDPETYKDSELTQKLATRYKTLSDEVEAAFARLHSLEEEIAALEAKRDTLLAEGGEE